MPPAQDYSVSPHSRPTRGATLAEKPSGAIHLSYLLARGSRGSVNRTIDTFLLCFGIAGSGVYWSVAPLSMNSDIIQRGSKKLIRSVRFDGCMIRSRCSLNEPLRYVRLSSRGDSHERTQTGKQGSGCARLHLSSDGQPSWSGFPVSRKRWNHRKRILD